jgi:hypothetical protein
MPFSEHDSVDHPVSLYAATKKANELMAHTYSHLFGLPTTGLRFFTVYGPWGRPDMALFLFTKAILEGGRSTSSTTARCSATSPTSTTSSRASIRVLDRAARRRVRQEDADHRLRSVGKQGGALSAACRSDRRGQQRRSQGGGSSGGRHRSDAALAEADFVIVAVPTPVDQAHQPDFGPLIGSSEAVGRNLKRGATVVFESTVYPGATEEVCIPIIEKYSGMKWKRTSSSVIRPSGSIRATRSGR